MDNILQNSLPIKDLVDKGIDWLTEHLAGLFKVIQVSGDAMMNFVSDTLNVIPPLLLLIVIPALAYYVSRKKGFTALTMLGLLFIYNQGLWEEMLYTFTLVLVASLISVLLGIPLGVWMAKSNRAKSIISPLLDFMQTMPAFVYLIPAFAFFGILRLGAEARCRRLRLDAGLALRQDHRMRRRQIGRQAQRGS